ncbi:MAG: hypothetical protein JEZ06_12940 [Anaerolineaceae bacterium]|nr:hypothetical protein [Anaerolineaceae bacterium]
MKTDRRKIKLIILGNLIGVINALSCAFLMPLISMHDFSFPMVPQDSVPFLRFMVTITLVFVFLIKNFIIVNLVIIILLRINSRKKAIIVVVLSIIISSYGTIFILAGKDIQSAFYIICHQIPDELWITAVIYLTGFYFLFIRNFDKPKEVLQENGVDMITIAGKDDI